MAVASIAFERGYTAGLAAAASIARRAAEGVRTRERPKDFGERAQGLTSTALDELAAAIEAEIGDPPPEPSLVLPSPSPRPISPATAAKLTVGALARAYADNDEGNRPLARAIASLALGYTGDECRDCGSFSMVRNGTCLKCENCGSTTGCS